MRERISIVILYSLCFGTPLSSAITIDMVTISNPGNAPDTRYHREEHPAGFGAVNYAYQIGKYEITAGQYTEFLNCVAQSDPFGLYTIAMNTSFGAKIRQAGSAPNFSYSVAPDWANRPVNYVTFWDAIRFCNWLHNGQPQGPQGAATTEAGAYHDLENDLLFGRNPNAKFFIPTEDEWYKAAYHDQSVGRAASYFDYATGTSTACGNDITEANNPHHNMNVENAMLAIGDPYYRSNVGEFALSNSPYGTFDQGGNVWEWNETVIGNGRGLRGGGWLETSIYSRADYRSSLPPSADFFAGGFRIAAVAIPEPSGIALLVPAIGLLRVRRKSR